MKLLALLVLITIMPNGLHWVDASNGEMLKNWNVARVAMLNALTPAHKHLLGTIAAHLATATDADYTAAAKELDSALSPTEKQSIIATYNAEHDKLRAIMRRNHMSDFKNVTVGHLGSQAFSGPAAGSLLLYQALNLGPATFNAMIDAH